MSDYKPTDIVKYHPQGDREQVAKTTYKTFKRVWEPKGFVLLSESEVMTPESAEGVVGDLPANAQEAEQAPAAPARTKTVNKTEES